MGFRGACLSLPPPQPPPPFPCTTVRGPIPSLPTGAYFCCRPARLRPAGLPCPGLPDGLDASWTLLCVPPPQSIAIVSWSGRTLPIGHFVVVCGPWVKPRHGRGPQAPVAALTNRRTVITSYIIVLLAITMVLGRQNFQFVLCGSGNVLQNWEKKVLLLSQSNFVLSPKDQDAQLTILFLGQGCDGGRVVMRECYLQSLWC